VVTTKESSSRRRWLILAICCSSLLIVSLDVSIVNVALPSIRRELGASVDGLQWIVDGYTLVLAILLLLSGAVADRIGRRRTFQLGLVLFSTGSILCGVAPSLAWLITARVIQAIGGSMLNPVALSIIANTFTEAKERARALGVWGAVVGVSLALGPVVGGALVDSVGWRAIFWINVPIGIAAIVLTQLFVPEFRARQARRFDPAGQLAIAVTLASLVFAIIEGPNWGWTSAPILGLFVVVIIGGIAFVVIESRREEPVIDLRFFRSAPFSGATVSALLVFAALNGFLFINALYLQDVRGYAPLTAGLLTLPLAVMTVIFAPLSGRLVGSTGARLPLVIAGVGIAAGAILLLPLSPTTPLAQIIAAYVLIGLGFGMANAPISNTAVSGMPRAQAGVAAAIASTGRQVGASLGVAIVGSLVAGVPATGIRFTAASHPAVALIIGLGVAVAILALVSTSRWAQGTARRVGRLLNPEETA
jgi:EmrB/QacA subfamily drug resistance transporter